MQSISVIPAREYSRQEAALRRDVESLLDVFRELREVEKMTGRAGLSARVRLAFADVLSAADRLAAED